MVKMPWNRNRTRPIAGQVPAEVEEYYQSTQKERRGVAWLMALFALLLTLLIGAVLFFGGRWLYRQLFTDNDSNTGSTSQQEETTNESAGSNADQPAQSSPDSSTSEPQNNGSTETQNNQSPSGESGANSQTTPSSEVTTPATGPEASEIPRTGPDGND